MLKPLKDEQADMLLRWLDPAYRWQNDSNLRRKFDARRKVVAVPNAVHQAGHIVDATLHSGSAEAERERNKET